MPSSPPSRSPAPASDRRDWWGGRQRGTGWLRGAGGLPRRVQWELDAIRLQLKVRAKARFWWLPEIHRLVEGAQGPHPTGDGAVGLRMGKTTLRITGPEAHALGRALAHGPTRLVMDQVLRRDRFGHPRGSLLVSAEGVEFVASGRLARLLGRSDQAIGMVDLVEVALEAGACRFRSRSGAVLDLQTRGDRRLRTGLGELLADASRETTPHVGPDGFIDVQVHSVVLGKTTVPAPPPVEADDALAEVLDAEPVLVPVSLHDTAGVLRPGCLLLRTRDVVWIPRAGSATTLPLQSLTLGSQEGGRRLTLFRGGKPVVVFFAEERVATRFSEVLAERLAWSRPEDNVDLEELLADAQLVEIEADGLEVLALAPEDLHRDVTLDGFEVIVERGWSIPVGGRVRVQCLNEDRVVWCQGLITVSELDGEHGRRVQVRPVGVVQAAERVRREDHRVEIDDIATVYMLSALDDAGQRRPLARARCQVVDLSASGIGLRMRSRVVVGDKLRVEVELDGHLGVFDGRVVYVKPDELGCRVGMSFLVRGESQRKRLASMLVGLERRRAQESELAEEVEGESLAGG